MPSGSAIDGALSFAFAARAGKRRVRFRNDSRRNPGNRTEATVFELRERDRPVLLVGRDRRGAQRAWIHAPDAVDPFSS